MGNFLGVEFYSSGKEKQSCCLVFPSSTKREIRHFHVAPATTGKKRTKKRDASAKLLFCLSKPIAFLTISLPSTSSLLKLPNEHDHGLDTMRKPWFAHEKQKGLQQNLVMSIQSFSKVPGPS